MSYIDFEKINKLVEQKYVNMQRHPSLPLRIFNYSHKAQHENPDDWTPEMNACRGLIVDDSNWIVARPFEKFWNLSQLPSIPAEPFTVTEKLDGSLGIMYPGLDGLPAIATRGSFTSDQALRATAILRNKYSHVKFNIPEYTYLFEIILPENRIVVDYGNREDIVLLAVIVTNSGYELTYDQVFTIAQCKGLSVVKQYDGLSDISALPVRDNAEGYVIRFASGLRAKVKFDEYVRLHRILTNVNARNIWDALRSGQGIDEYIERVPDEFYSWVKKTAQDLQLSYKRIEVDAKIIFDKLWHEIKRGRMGRKEFAEYCTGSEGPPFRSVLFAMLDGKPYDQIIWKGLRPEATKPFRVEE